MYQALSNVYGKIEQILLAYPGTEKLVTSAQVYDFYKDLFRAFGDRVTFVILGNFISESKDPSQLKVTEEKLENEFKAALNSAHLAPQHHVVHIESFHGGLNLKSKRKTSKNYEQNQWVQDPFLLMKRVDGSTVFLEPFYTRDSFNQMIAEQVASVTDLLIKPTKFELEGGNVLVGDDYALIGRNLLERNLHFFAHEPEKEREAKLTGAFKRMLGVKYIIWIGKEEKYHFSLGVNTGKEGRQPLFHLDMFLTLAGKSKKEGDELVLVADIEPEHVIGGDSFSEELLELKKAFDGIAKFLQDYVKHNPGPRFKVERLLMAGKVDRGEFTPYSYNNCQVEWFHGISRIYLPSYPSIKSLKNSAEARNEKTLKGLFGKVTFIKNAFDVYSEQQGSLHCMTKVLNRSAY